MVMTIPPLPQGVKSGVGGMIGRQVLVGLGSAGTDLFRLDLDAVTAGWQACAPLPAPAREGAAFAMAGGMLVVISGAGKETPDAASPVVLSDLHIYDSARDQWRRGADAPVGLLGASAFAVDADTVAVVGGYNKPLFDAFVAELALIDGAADPARLRAHMVGYMGMQPQEYRWNDRIWLYSLSRDAWTEVGAKRGLPTTGAAVLPDGDAVLLVNGEVKPGLRSADILRLTCGAGGLVWEDSAPLPPVAGADAAEGLAGALAGYAGDMALIAGGVNFPGARARAASGQWYAHDGLTKTWRAEVYARINGAWQIAGHLPRGLSHGIAVSVGDSLLLIGGEDQAMQAQTATVVLTWDHGSGRLVVTGEQGGTGAHGGEGAV